MKLAPVIDEEARGGRPVRALRSMPQHEQSLGDPLHESGGFLREVLLEPHLTFGSARAIQAVPWDPPKP